MNRLFFNTLRKNSTVPFELIVIDNISSDGSREYFEGVADHVIANSENYSYPVCQNQGIAVAKYELMAFLNNDLLVSKGWDLAIIEAMEEGGYDVISCSTNDFLEDKRSQKRLNRRYKAIKYAMRALFGVGYRSLEWMVRLTYGSFEGYAARRRARFGKSVKCGFSGSAVLFTRSAIEKIGLWDERLQEADFDLFCRTMDRHLSHGDIQPMQVALGVFMHHYQRLTLRSKHLTPFVDAANFITSREKWGARHEELLSSID